MPKKSVAGTAADPTVPFTKATIDEKEYSLVFDFNAIAQAENMTGQSLLVGLGRSLGGNAGFSDYQALLFAATRKAHPDLTHAAIGLVCMDITNMSDIRTGILRAYRESLPEKKRALIEVEDES